MTYLIPVIIAYITGVGAAASNAPFVLLSAVILIFLVFLKLRLKEQFSVIFIPIILAFFLLGFFLAHLAMLKTGAGKLDFLENKKIKITCVITNVAQIKEDKTLLKADLRNIIYNNVEYAKKIPTSLALNREKYPSRVLKYGDLIEIENTKLRRADLPSYPGQFNYQKYLLQSGINYTAYVSDKDVKILTRNNGPFAARAVFAAREFIINTLNRTVTGEEAALISSIVLGEYDILSQDLKTALIKTGTLHLIAASGFNVSILIMFCVTVCGILRIKRQITAIFTVIIIIFYALLCSASPSIVRAAIIGIFAMISLSAGKEKDAPHLFILSALLILLAKPLWLFNVGFQLSFLACLGIIVITPLLYKKLSFMPNYLNSLISTTLGAQIALLPVLIYYFGKISVVFILANILLVPIVEILLPASLIHIILSAVLKFLSPVSAFMCYGLSFIFLKTIHLLSALPFALIYLAKPQSFALALFYIAGAAALLFLRLPDKRKYLKQTGIIAASLALLIFSVNLTENSRSLRVTFLNVKAGDCAVIRAPGNKTILIDTGYRYKIKNKFYDCADSVILPYLKDIGVKKINLVLISHPHKDHLGGLPRLISAMPVELVAGNLNADGSVFTRQAVKLLRIKNIPLLPLSAGDSIRAGKNAFFSILAPKNSLPVKNKSNSGVNNGSIVAKLTYKNISFLFTGDIEKEEEAKLCRGKRLKADILKIAHGGSKTSSSRLFIEKVNPSFAVISSSLYNRFGWPHKKVIDTLNANHIKYFTTSQSGPVTFKTYGKSIKIEPEK